MLCNAGFSQHENALEMAGLNIALVGSRVGYVKRRMPAVFLVGWVLGRLYVRFSFAALVRTLFVASIGSKQQSCVGHFRPAKRGRGGIILRMPSFRLERLR